MWNNNFYYLFYYTVMDFDGILFLRKVIRAKIIVPVTTSPADITKLISFDPVRSEIKPVSVGATTAELIPKKLNKLKARPNVSLTPARRRTR